MPGLCGWVVSNEDTSDGQCIDLMTRKMIRTGQENIVTATGLGWGAGFGPDQAIGSIYSGSCEFALVSGRLELLDRELKVAAEKDGLGQTLVTAYRESGIDLLQKLGGQFSLAIALPDQQKLLLAIDRMGIQSVFYAPVHGGIAFASSLPSLVRHPDVSQAIDYQSIFDYLYFHVIPGPGSIYKNVCRLLPGTCAEFDHGVLRDSVYWTASFSRETKRVPFQDLKSEFLSILTKDMETEFGSGKKIGCFLSGGTDSSTVTGMATRVSGESVKTYSIGFDEQGYDEMEYARITAKHFGTDHHEYYVTGNDVVDLIPKISAEYGEPFGNSSAIPVYYCALMAREDGVDTMLAGDGGDELFGGNERYAAQNLFSAYERIPRSVRHFAIEPMLSSFPLGEKLFPVRKARRYVEQANTPMPARMEGYNLLNVIGLDQIFEPDFLRLVDPEKPPKYISATYENAKAHSMINKMLALDLKFTLADNDLPKVVRMCDLAGIRASFPLLSDALVEFSARLPVDDKVRYLKLRYFFKQALRDFLPTAVIKKKKHGFGLPVGRWLISHRGMRDLAFDSLMNLKKRGIVQAGFIDELLEKRLAEHPPYYGSLVWVFMLLEHWYAGRDAG